MKNKGILILCLALFVFISDVYSQKGITIRPYFRAGINLLPPSLEDLDFNGDWSGASVKKNPMVLGAGSQFMLQRTGIGLGVDVGAGTLFTNKVIYDEGVGTATNLDQQYSVYVVLFAEYRLGELFFIQGGLGPHIAPWYWEYYYESNNYSDVENWDSGVAVKLALMAAVGAEIPVNSRANLFVLGKFDAIFQYGLMLPFTINIGASFNL